SCVQSMSSLVTQLKQRVSTNGFDGVDIDFEDTVSFEQGSTYDGISFLVTLTNALYTSLSFPHNIITHAPQSPYWEPNSMWTYNPTMYPKPPCFYVYSKTGTAIAWYNTQFYNQNEGSNYSYHEAYTEYNNIVTTLKNDLSLSYLPTIFMVFGLPVSQ